MQLQIFILGILCEGNNHPYEIKKLIQKNISDEEIVKVNDGTLYYRFESLLKKGYITKIEVSRENNRPERTTYGITDQGREALKEDIYKSFQTFSNLRPLYASLLFLKHVDLAKIIDLTEKAVERTKKRFQLQNDSHLPVWWGNYSKKISENIDFITSHARSNIEYDLDWLEKLLIFLRGTAKDRD
ncbi:PadR family transcriptional regulator [Fictibacillus fluitans]|uniref:PadR family transcriptional regulator n=1 Tax=Fictibacillus fluitans TaxID=3058422 RepID=A0ABT8HQ64_9BACL|nr:PadR family transcriptional regulator [Fictibacillus sp. NE201]MDN4522879.1 PadR family transcriptional regulator [Fictibacillus sp. NE201]